MKKALALSILLAFVSVTTIRLGPKAWAKSPQAVVHEGKGCSVPKEWGQLKGVADRSIAFEDPSGTIRIVDLGPCMRGETQLIVKISRP
jgi:hypothetical protein